MSGMSDDTPRQYLLRRLPDAEADQFEERLLSDDECAERLREAEDDLLDDYAAARLGPDEREAVERYLLGSSDGEQRLRFARALADVSRQAGAAGATGGADASGGTSASPGMRRWIGPLLLLVAASVAYLVLLPATQEPEPQRIPPGESSPVAPEAAAPQTAARPADDTPAYAVLLLAEVQRGADNAHQIAIPDGTQRLRLQLEVAGNARTPGEPVTFQIVVQDATGQELFAAASLGARQVGAYRVVEVEVPVRALGAGSRRVVLSRVGNAGLRPVFDWEIDLHPATATP